MVCLCWKVALDSSIILGSLATAATFIVSICQNRKQDRLLYALKESELEAKYLPDLVINRFGTIGGNRYSIVLENRGVPLTLVSITGKDTGLDSESTDKWCQSGHRIESGDSFYIPFTSGIHDFEEEWVITIVVRTPISKEYRYTILKRKGFLTLSPPQALDEKSRKR